VVNVPNGADVDVRLGTLKLAFCHDEYPLALTITDEILQNWCP
jgi:hypothetical protein